MGGIAGGQSKQESDLVTQELEGIFGGGAKRAKTRELGGSLEDILKSIGTGSEASGAFLQELLNPQFGAQTASEQALLESVGSLTKGASALRGLGPSTQAGLAQTLAPELVNLRQKRLANLGQGAQFELGQRGQSLQGLFELLGLSAPQVVAGQKQRGRSFQGSLNLGSGE